jgi:hypothetical protein
MNATFARVVELSALALLGCSTTTLPQTELALVTETPDEDSAVYVEGALHEEELELSLWLRGAAEVFGVAAHLTHGGSLLGVEAEPALGTELEARHVVVEREGDVSVGGTRLSPRLGGIPMHEPTRLARLRFAAPTEPTSYVVERITVRRPDGSFVPTTGFGAAILERGAE